MKREFAVLVLNSMSGIGPALKTDYYISLFRQYICDLSLAFISPVGTYYSFYHIETSAFSPSISLYFSSIGSAHSAINLSV